MKKRRLFLKKTIAALGLLSFPMFVKKAEAGEMKITLNNSFLHHVYFWLKKPDNDQDCKRFEEGLALLVSIPEIKMYHIGKAVQSDREVVDDSFSYSYLAVFNDKADQDHYQIHPVHLKFIEEYGDLWGKVVVYDAIN